MAQTIVGVKIKAPVEGQEKDLATEDAIQILSTLLPEIKIKEHVFLESYSKDFAPSNDGRTGKPDLSKLTEAEKKTNSANELDALLDLEREHLVQLERMACLSDVLNVGHASNDAMYEHLASMETAFEGLYRASLSVLRTKSADIEKAIMSLHAFLREASGTSGNSARYQTDQVGILNAPAAVFTDDAFGAGQFFGPLDRSAITFDTSYALWVSDGEFEGFTEFQRAASKAMAHEALLIVNAEMEQSFFDKRFDLRFFTQAGVRKDLQIADLQRLNALQSVAPEAGHVAVCATPLRVRSADENASEYLDATIPLSFVLAGKLFWAANESENHSAATTVTNFQKVFEIAVDYIDNRVLKDPKVNSCPANFGFEGSLNRLQDAQVVAAMAVDRGILETDKSQYQIGMLGMHTIKTLTGIPRTDDQYAISTVLVKASMARLLKVAVQDVAVGPKSNAKAWCRAIEGKFAELCEGPKALLRKIEAKALDINGNEVTDPVNNPASVFELKVVAYPLVGVGQIPVSLDINTGAVTLPATGP